MSQVRMGAAPATLDFAINVFMQAPSLSAPTLVLSTIATQIHHSRLNPLQPLSLRIDKRGGIITVPHSARLEASSNFLRIRRDATIRWDIRKSFPALTGIMPICILQRGLADAPEREGRDSL